jgi:hypothetical protein
VISSAIRGAWSTADDSAYTILLGPPAVSELAGLPLASAVAGTFHVLINADHLVVTSGSPSTVGAGALFGATIQVQNGAGFLDSGYNGNVTLTLSTSPGHDTLGGTTIIQAVHGVATYSNLSMHVATVGVVLQASAGIPTPATAGSVIVTPTAASTIVVAGFPGSTTAGAPQGFTVTALDPFGNVATGYTGTVHFTSIDPKVVLLADYAFTPFDKTKHIFIATRVKHRAGSPSQSTHKEPASAREVASAGIRLVGAIGSIA